MSADIEQLADVAVRAFAAVRSDAVYERFEDISDPIDRAAWLNVANAVQVSSFALALAADPAEEPTC